MAEGAGQIPQAFREKLRAEALVAFDAKPSTGFQRSFDAATDRVADLLLAAFSEALEEMIKVRELNSHDVGWAVPTTDLESFLERQQDAATLNVSGGEQ